MKTDGAQVAKVSCTIGVIASKDQLTIAKDSGTVAKTKLEAVDLRLTGVDGKLCKNRIGTVSLESRDCC